MGFFDDLTTAVQAVGIALVRAIVPSAVFPYVKGPAGAPVPLESSAVGLKVDLGSATVEIDASGLATSVKQSDGTQKAQRVDASGNVAPAGDAVARKAFVSVTDGTNTLPTLDVAARKGFVAVTDGTNTAAVKAASTAAAATDPAAVVTLSPNGGQAIASRQASTTAANITQVAVPQTTAAAICSTTACNTGVLLRALKANTATCYVGGSNLTTTNGIELDAGESVFIPVTDAAVVFSVSASTNQKIQALAL